MKGVCQFKKWCSFVQCHCFERSTMFHPLENEAHRKTIDSLWYSVSAPNNVNVDDFYIACTYVM